MAAIVTLGVTTSCEDMFDIESSRVVIEQNHNLNSSADSAYSTIGVLQSLRQIADRYIILGEVRGDLIEINENTKTSLRNLAEFNFEDENEYLAVKDYYAIINNCNYVLAKMDTTISHNNVRVMTDEYAALIGIRAWTYLQLAINHGKVPFYLNPITTVADSEKEYPVLDVKGIAAEMIPQLIPYVDYDLPVFTHQYIYPPLQLVLGDYYLWSGDYQNAWDTYWDFMTTHPDFNFSVGPDGNKETFRGHMSLNRSLVDCMQRGSTLNFVPTNWMTYQSTSNTENLAYIPMERSSANGTVSGVGSLFASQEGNHSLNPSTYLKELGNKQAFIFADVDKNDNLTGGYSVISIAGDVRNKYYMDEMLFGDGDFQIYEKLCSYSMPDGVTLEIITPQIVLYRRAITYLRAAEAANALAMETGNRKHAENAFNLMKNAYKVFFPEGHVLQKELEEYYIGTHARGCGVVRMDTTHFVLKPSKIAQHFEGLTDSTVTFADSVKYIDELIIDELALEAACEGNRFGDLVRFAKRRQAWGESNYQDLLAKRVASRKGAEALDNELYNKLQDESNWYLPLK